MFQVQTEEPQSAKVWDLRSQHATLVTAYGPGPGSVAEREQVDVFPVCIKPARHADVVPKDREKVEPSASSPQLLSR